MPEPLTILCIASYHKGQEFLREAKRQGARVFLVTSESLRDADWPRESVDDIYFVKDDHKRWQIDDLLLGASHLARKVVIDRIVPLDDFDLEKASTLREHLRVGGMGETTTRYFRDKLAMRLRAREAGIPVPRFVHVLNEAAIRAFTAEVPAPWVLKPRLSAGTIGIRKVQQETELWQHIDALDDQASYYLLEQFVGGDVFHVDSIVDHSRVLTAVASGYGRPPFDVSHGGGVFTTRLLPRGSADERAALASNRAVLGALGLVRGVSHTEFIKGADGTWYFLETSARVGGAHIVELVEAATGANFWQEWAKVELAGGKTPYVPPVLREDYAGLVTCLTKDERPDLSSFSDPEVVWRMDKAHHAGLIVASPSHARVSELVAAYAERLARDFSAFLPPGDAPRD
ncbi:MAG: acetyl-CoA carboxylase biotin carboxylase subunit family protein [Vicinamibacterales bacterium]